jgi:arginyl-tRNA synthetase
MEDGDEAALGLWKRFRDFSIKKLEEMYARLNIHFDVYAGESLVSPEAMKKQVDLLEEKNLLCTDRGAVLANLEEYKLGKVVVRKAGEYRQGCAGITLTFNRRHEYLHHP